METKLGGRFRASALAVAVLAGSGCVVADGLEDEPDGTGEATAQEEEIGGHGVPKWHEPGAHSGPHVLTCYGGCAEPHYDPSACGGSTACCRNCIDGTWWYSTEQRNFGCGAKLELRRGDRCVIVEVADNGPADWVEDQALARCGVGWIIDTSPLVHDYFGGGCGWSECFIVDVRQVADDLPQGPCASCPCDGPPAHPVFELRAAIDDVPGQERDPCALYESGGIFDLQVGQTAVQRFYVANTGTGVGRNVVVGVWVEDPYLRLRRWDVYDNWPGHTCGAEWCPNDANANPSNPSHDDPGASFRLYLNAFSPGETKMIEMTVEAAAPSLVRVDHPDVRLWVAHVDDYYEKADFWSTDFNNVGGYQTWNGGDLRVWSQTDVLGPEACEGSLDEDCDGLVDETCGGDGGADGSADAGVEDAVDVAADGAAEDAGGEGPRYVYVYADDCDCRAAGAPAAASRLGGWPGLLCAAWLGLRRRRVRSGTAAARSPRRLGGPGGTAAAGSADQPPPVAAT